ncbi:MAG: hypothetical protein KDC98_15085, partial [Planctomycetes bacterium]|nr:hypothetical protein [Planctomycetota bacterium]
RCALEQWLHDIASGERRHGAATRRRQRLEHDLLPLANRQLEDSRALAEHGSLEPLLLLDSLARAHAARLATIDAALDEALRVIDLEALYWIDASLPSGAPR